MVLFLSIMLIVRRIPEELKGTPYSVSRRIMGCALAIFPLLIFVYYGTPLNNTEEYYATAIHLGGCLPTSALIHIAFLALLGEKIDYRSLRFKLYILGILIYIAAIFLGVEFVGSKRTLRAGNTILLGSLAAQISYFYSKYKTALERNDRKYIREIRIHMLWLKKSVFMISSIAFTICVIPMFFSDVAWLGIFNTCYGLLVFVYIYESYNRFLINYHYENMVLTIGCKPNITDVSKNPIPKPQEVALSEELFAQISTQVGLWIAEKQYCRGNITIIAASKEMFTNRTYLSAYINSVYKCSFKTWITRLRVEEAKRLLTGTNVYTISEISDMVGFASHTSFIHVFRKNEGMSPAKWKDSQNL